MENVLKRKGIPDGAKLAFKGVIFEVWQWQQEMFDGTLKTFERIWRPPTVEVIATIGDRILIEYQDQPDRKGSINLVSGRADKSDDLLSEAKRELLEETGYESSDWREFLRHGAGGGKVVHEVCYFIARNCKKVGEQNLDAGERIEVKLITFEELLALADNPKFWQSAEFINFLLSLRSDKGKSEEFKKLIFLS